LQLALLLLLSPLPLSSSLPPSPPSPLPPSSPPSPSSSPSLPLPSSDESEEFSSSEETSDSSEPSSLARSTDRMYVHTSSAIPWESSESSDDAGGKRRLAIPRTRRKTPPLSTRSHRSPPMKDSVHSSVCRRSDAASPDLSCPCPWLDGREEGVEKEATDDQRMCEDNNGASRLFIEVGGNYSSPTTLTEQSQVFNNQFKSPEGKSGSRRRFA
jgi:hypothetical protein